MNHTTTGLGFTYLEINKISSQIDLSLFAVTSMVCRGLFGLSTWAGSVDSIGFHASLGSFVQCHPLYST